MKTLFGVGFAAGGLEVIVALFLDEEPYGRLMMSMPIWSRVEGGGGGSLHGGHISHNENFTSRLLGAMVLAAASRAASLSATTMASFAAASRAV
jgi:hypothetical protein